MSGGTRCNITQATDNRGIVAAYGAPGKFLHSALGFLWRSGDHRVFEAEGVAVKVEETGKIFPVSTRHSTLLQALLNRLQRSGAELALGEPLLQMATTAMGFTLATPLRTVTTPCVILTTGGQSYPGFRHKR